MKTKLEDLISINENETIKRESDRSLLVIGTKGFLLLERQAFFFFLFTKTKATPKLHQYFARHPSCHHSQPPYTAPTTPTPPLIALHHQRWPLTPIPPTILRIVIYSILFQSETPVPSYTNVFN
jgi:hypothetical protein